MILTTFIFLAGLGLAAGVLGLILYKNWTVTHLNGTYHFDEKIRPGMREKDESSDKVKLWHKEKSIVRLKGVYAGTSFRYSIPVFYQKLFSGDKKVRIDALIVFGFFTCTVFTFLAVGTGFLRDGDSTGWAFICISLLAVFIVVFGHIRSTRNSRKNTN
ncbi:MAG: hypothetical protein JXB26_07500 [Candidatus Aminicenantes bacterium]|nr:hypothetical protein [Candidatus Aminicenantes bacterium]